MNTLSSFDQLEVQNVLKKLRAFLNSTRLLWEKEIIQNYPDFIEPFDRKFIDKLDRFNDNDLYALGHQKYFKELKLPLPDYLKEFDDITHAINQILIKPPPFDFKNLNLPPQAFQHLKHKKRHEFFALIALLKSFNLIPSQETIIDFCGGAGYLSRNLAYYFNTSAISVDFDQDLQTRGALRNKRFIPQNAKEINLVCCDILNDEKTLENLIARGSPHLSIHACAHLLDQMLNNAIKMEAKWILGIGCCYYKTKDFNYCLSSLLKQQPFKTPVESLVLASRGHDVSLDNFKFSLKVKRKRYLLHILLKDYLNLDFLPAGNCAKEMYALSFKEYALDRLTVMFNSNFAEDKLNLILEVEKDYNKKLLIEKMLYCNFIRMKFGRLIEYVIVFDRLLFLLENGYQGAVYEIFDSEISPRNLAILAQRDNFI